MTTSSISTELLQAPPTQSYSWRDYSCTYEYWVPPTEPATGVPLLLVHPIGVGLSRRFWHPFCRTWYGSGQSNMIYNPDLLGCGDSDLPAVAYQPEDWADQLQVLLQDVIQQPVVLVVQGALLPVAIALVQQQREPSLIKGLVLAGPPAWGLITQQFPEWQQKIIWNLLNSPLGAAFYRYARRPQFLQSFSTRQLFADATDVDSQWIKSLTQGAANPATRHAVFSFLAGFWRRNYEAKIRAIHQPTLVLFGTTASSISQTGQAEQPQERLDQYLAHLPQAQGQLLPGRNVLPYESTEMFVQVVAQFVNHPSAGTA